MDGAAWQLGSRADPIEALIVLESSPEFVVDGVWEDGVGITKRRGRPTSPFKDCSPKTKKRRIESTRNDAIASLAQFFDDQDPHLANEAKAALTGLYYYSSLQSLSLGSPIPSFSLPEESQYAFMVLKKNIKSLYSSLPHTSPVKTSLFVELFEGISAASSAEILGISYDHALKV